MGHDGSDGATPVRGRLRELRQRPPRPNCCPPLVVGATIRVRRREERVRVARSRLVVKVRLGQHPDVRVYFGHAPQLSGRHLPSSRLGALDVPRRNPHACPRSSRTAIVRLRTASEQLSTFMCALLSVDEPARRVQVGCGSRPTVHPRSNWLRTDSQVKAPNSTGAPKVAAGRRTAQPFAAFRSLGLHSRRSRAVIFSNAENGVPFGRATCHGRPVQALRTRSSASRSARETPDGPHRSPATRFYARFAPLAGVQALINDALNAAS